MHAGDQVAGPDVYVSNLALFGQRHGEDEEEWTTALNRALVEDQDWAGDRSDAACAAFIVYTYRQGHGGPCLREHKGESMKFRPIIALVAVILGLSFSAGTVLADHEDDCRVAIASGDYNVITGQSGNIQGTSGDDVIIGSEGNDTINAGGGDDVVCARGGSDFIDGGSGNDILIGDRDDGIAGDPDMNAGSDTIIGGSGTDELYGDEGSDVLDAGSGGDELIGGPGNDDLSGGSGNDMLFGDTPAGNAMGTNDDCDGGSGTDTALGCESTSRIP